MFKMICTGKYLQNAETMRVNVQFAPVGNGGSSMQLVLTASEADAYQIGAAYQISVAQAK